METLLVVEENPDLFLQNSAGCKTKTTEVEMPLAALRTGECGTVLRMEGNEEFRSKMLALGIIPGKVITVTRGDQHQSFILRVDQSRIMMDWKSLNRIYVQSGAI